jgi:hypothetical protein
LVQEIPAPPAVISSLKIHEFPPKTTDTFALLSAFVSITMPPSLSAPELTSLDLLDDDHEQTLRRALDNILSTDVSEFAFAQILDGLPTTQSFRDSFFYLSTHPVFELDHSKLCDGFIDKARHFRAQFNPLTLDLEQSVSGPDNPVIPCISHYG